MGFADAETSCPTLVRLAAAAFKHFEFFDALWRRDLSRRRVSSGSAGMVTFQFASDRGDPREHVFSASGAGWRAPDRVVRRSLHLLPLDVVRVLPMVRDLTGAQQCVCREIVTTHSTSTASAASQMLGKKARIGINPVRAFSFSVFQLCFGRDHTLIRLAELCLVGILLGCGGSLSEIFCV